MGKVFDELTPAVRQFVLAQRVFFVGTAPLSQNGHVNVSPKGLDGTFVFLNRDTAARATTRKFPAEDSLCTVVYLDVGGSGIETVAHLLENERITLMFCAFEGSPKIVRFSGTGLVVEPHDEGWDTIASQFSKEAQNTFFLNSKNGQEVKARNFIVVDVHRIADSCGFGVPYMHYQSQRTIFPEKFQRDPLDKLVKRRVEVNTKSIDGLPGLPSLQNGAAKAHNKVEVEKSPTCRSAAPTKNFAKGVQNDLWSVSPTILARDIAIGMIVAGAIQLSLYLRAR